MTVSPHSDGYQDPWPDKTDCRRGDCKNQRSKRIYHQRDHDSPASHIREQRLVNMHRRSFPSRSILRRSVMLLVREARPLTRSLPAPVKIDITDDGSVSVCGTDKEMMDKAIEMIKIITTEFKAGQIFKGKVVSIKEFGAFAEFAPGKEGMVHISRSQKSASTAWKMS